MWRHGIRRWSWFAAALAVVVTAAAPMAALAQDATAAAAAPAAITQETIDQLTLTTNNVWMMLCAGLVFIMHLGFSALESGLCRQKNTVNILTKNVAIVAIGLLTYFVCGFGLMYPGFEDGSRSFLGFGGMGLTLPENGLTAAYAKGGYTYWTDFLFQAMFAATAATIVSGAVAERVKLMPFLLFSTLFVAICYPILGSWKWGYGWLNTVGFHDFAGSTLVHSVGGWGALAGVILLGPRIGKYGTDGRVNPIFGHSMPLAVIGVFMLWLGWFGFNGGSVLSADPGATSLVLVTTCMAAAAGAIAALFVAYFVLGNPDLSMCLNGILGGLVGITAGADVTTPMQAIIIGAIAGTLVVFAVIALDKLRLDDPVGAIPVHLVCGTWGTLAVGIFGSKASMAQLGYQALGVAAYGVVTFAFAMTVFGILKATTGIRVSASEEIEGLDLGEHGMEAYPGFAKDAGADMTSAPTATAVTPKASVVTA